MNELATTRRDLARTSSRKGLPDAGRGTEQLVTFFLGGQMLALEVRDVLEIIIPEKIHPVPLAPPEVAGAINLRGRVVTVIDMRRRLGLPPGGGRKDGGRYCVTVDHGGESYGLLVDSVGDMLEISVDQIERPPPDPGPAVAATLLRGLSPGGRPAGPSRPGKPVRLRGGRARRRHPAPLSRPFRGRVSRPPYFAPPAYHNML